MQYYSKFLKREIKNPTLLTRIIIPQAAMPFFYFAFATGNFINSNYLFSIFIYSITLPFVLAVRFSVYNHNLTDSGKRIAYIVFNYMAMFISVGLYIIAVKYRWFENN